MRIKFVTHDFVRHPGEQQVHFTRTVIRSHAARAAHATRRERQTKHIPDDSLDKYLQHSYETLVLQPFKGNSDPFLSSSPAVIPEYGHILSFAKHAALPSTYENTFVQRLSGLSDTSNNRSLSASRLISWGASNRFWRNVTHNFDDPGVFYAFLNVYAVILSTTCDAPWLKTMSIRLRLQALSHLRKTLRDVQILEGHRANLIATLALLFEGACNEGDMAAAEAHAKMLKHVFKPEHAEVTFPSRVLASGLDLAIKSGGRASSTVTWCIDQLHRFHTAAQTAVPMPPIYPSKIHSNITYGPLLGIWLRNRRTLLTMKQCEYWAYRWNNFEVRTSAFDYFISERHLNQFLLNEIYFDLVEEKSMQAASLIERLTQAALAVAMLYMWHHSMNELIINDVDRKPWSAMLMDRLRYCVKAIAAADTKEDLLEFAEAHLWLVYIGAMAEMLDRREGRSDSCTNDWFCKQLWLYASRAEVQTWNEMQRIADCFFYADFLGLDGSTWFEDILLVGLMDDYSINMRPRDCVPVSMRDDDPPA